MIFRCPFLKFTSLSFIIAELIILCALCLFTDKHAYAQNKPLSEDSLAAKKPVNHIYLTFDDGPLEGSDEVSDAVQTENIEVTIFVVGSNVLKNQRLQDYYHLYEHNPYIEIGNHSYSHARDAYGKFYKNAEQVLLDFLKNQMFRTGKSGGEMIIRMEEDYLNAEDLLSTLDFKNQILKSREGITFQNSIFMSDKELPRNFLLSKFLSDIRTGIISAKDLDEETMENFRRFTDLLRGIK